jgi:hypothetical protein
MNHYFTPRIFGQTPGAIRELEWIVEHYGTRRDLTLVADSYLYLGRSYARVGRQAEAEVMWRRGAELFPSHPGLQRARTP